jgi:hypothetical protein
MSKVVRKILKEKATCTLFIPVWKSTAYWPLICENEVSKSFVISFRYFNGFNITHKGRGKNSIFGKKKNRKALNLWL